VQTGEKGYAFYRQKPPQSSGVSAKEVQYYFKEVEAWLLCINSFVKRVAPIQALLMRQSLEHAGISLPVQFQGCMRAAMITGDFVVRLLSSLPNCMS